MPLLSCLIYLESLLLRVCVSLTLVAGELPQCEAKPILFSPHPGSQQKAGGLLISGRGEMLVQGKVTGTGLTQGQMLFDATPCTHMGGHLPLVRRLSSSGFFFK